MKTNLFIRLFPLAGLALLIGFACGKSNNSYGNSSGGGNGGGSTSNSISLYNISYSPASTTVKLGTVVTWTNNDPITHTVTSNDGTTFNSGFLTPGSKFSYTTTVAGTINYHCMVHGLAMSGTLIVTP